MKWYDNINADAEPESGNSAIPVSEMQKVSDLARRLKQSSSQSSLTASMTKWGVIGAGAGLLGGLLAKKNIMLFVLAGTGTGTIAGYMIDVFRKKEVSNTNLNTEVDNG